MQSVRQWIASMSCTPERLCAVVFMLALVIRVAGVFATGSYHTPPESEAVNIAKSLATQNVFGNPYPVPTGPSAHAPPGFSWVLSLVYRATRPGDERELASALLACLVAAAVYGVLPWLAVRLGLSVWAGFTGGLIGALTPLFLWIETRGIHDGPWTALAYLLSLGFLASLKDSDRIRDFVLTGAVWGGAFLFGPVLLLPFLLSAGIVWWWRRRSAKPNLAPLTALAGMAIVVVAPWSFRNYRQFGSVFWIRDNFGLELHFGNNDHAAPLMDDNKVTSAQYHPFARRRQALRILEVGEAEFFREHGRSAREWIRAHPRLFAHLTLQRIRYFWFPPLNHPLKRLALYSLLLLGVAGLCWMLIRQPYAGQLLVPAWLGYPVVYYLVAVDFRYIYPIYPFYLSATGYLVYSMALKLMPQVDERRKERNYGRMGCRSSASQ